MQRFEVSAPAEGSNLFLDLEENATPQGNFSRADGCRKGVGSFDVLLHVCSVPAVIFFLSTNVGPAVWLTSVMCMRIFLPVGSAPFLCSLRLGTPLSKDLADRYLDCSHDNADTRFGRDFAKILFTLFVPAPVNRTFETCGSSPDGDLVRTWVQAKVSDVALGIKHC